MNERIRVLAEQATEVSEWLSGNCSPDAPDLEKFAELIVRECIERVRNQYTTARDQHNRSEREQGIVECGVASVIALEELVQESTDRWYKENILGVNE